MSLAVLVYGISQGIADREVGPEVPISIFHPTFLILVTGVSNAFVAGDLFNLFVSFEILLTASYVLLTSGGTRERLRAGAPYIVVSLLSSLIFLVGHRDDLRRDRHGEHGRPVRRSWPRLPAGIVAVLQALLLVAFGVKAAVFPMSAWLPDSYPSAPAPVTAVFAGLLTKVGIYAIIRVQTLLFPTGSYGTLLMIAALLTMVVGILGAISQSGIKRMLSFTLVSHIGYMLFGVALGSETGLGAAIYYVAHHILVQTALFLAVGLIERVAGTTVLARLGGLAAAAPVLAILFFIPAMNLAGVPPLSGFLGKVGLFEAGVQDGRVLALILVAGGALTSLLTLYAIIRVWGRAFWRPVPEVSGPEVGVRCAGNRVRPLAGRPAPGSAGGPTAGHHREGGPPADRDGRGDHRGGRDQPAADGGGRADLRSRRARGGEPDRPQHLRRRRAGFGRAAAARGRRRVDGRRADERACAGSGRGPSRCAAPGSRVAAAGRRTC